MKDSGQQRITVSAGHSCYRQLTWECKLEPQASTQLVIERLVAHGYVDESNSPLVVELTHPCQHRVVVVPKTGRIQLRVHYLTPQAERASVAQTFASLLRDIVDE